MRGIFLCRQMTFCLVVASLLSGISLKSLACDRLPWLDDPSIPECPAGGSKILPDTSPVMAVVVSFQANPDDQALMWGVVQQSLLAAGDRLPLIIIPGAPQDFIDHVQGTMERLPEDSPFFKYKDRIKNNFIFPKASRFRWQQDYFKSTFDPRTGLPMIRPILNYKNGNSSGSEMASSIAKEIGDACKPSIKLGMTVPPVLEPDYEANNAVMGGNAQGLPSGLYLTGDNQSWEKMGKYYGGNPTDLVQIPTSWLHVGHVDEVVSVIKDKTQKAPCDFALSVMSPKKALEIMKDPQYADLPFMQFPEQRKFRYLDRPVMELCSMVASYRKRLRLAHHAGGKYMRDSSGQCRLAPSLADPFVSQQAQLGLILPPELEPIRGHYEQLASEHLLLELKHPHTQETLFACDAEKITNREVVAALVSDTNPDRTGDYNALIQNEMDQAESTMMDKLKKRTGCQNIQVAHMPGLFYGAPPVRMAPDTVVTVNGQNKKLSDLTFEEEKQLPLKSRYQGLPQGRGFSFLPNAVNAVSIEGTVILPHQFNPAFSHSVVSQYEKIGLKTADVDSWRAHTEMGNVHCATNTLRICRPKTN